MLPGLAPPPVTVRDPAVGAVVAAELETLDATVVFDTTAQKASVEAIMAFTIPATVPSGACAAFDLRQRVRSASLDGMPLQLAALAAADLGGGPGAAMRVIRRPVAAGTRHRLELAYELGTPAVDDAAGIVWEPGRVSFDVWCSDLAPGRYLEQWWPVSLCQDRFAFALEIEIRGAAEPHRVVANGAVTPVADDRWRVSWPSHFTSLSSLLRIAPAARLREASADGVVLTADPAVEPDVRDLAERVAGWLSADRWTFGPSVHGSPFVAHVWESSRGMEYDGATTGSEGSLEHEVFHSWFGRGVKPASASDGWIDEALATWWTSDHPDHPRRAPTPLALDEKPVVLAPPSPWSRHTPREAYRTGYQLMADLAFRSSAEALTEALSAFYVEHAGGFVQTEDFRVYLSEALSVDVSPWWDRYVHGIAIA